MVNANNVQYRFMLKVFFNVSQNQSRPLFKKYLDQDWFNIFLISAADLGNILNLKYLEMFRKFATHIFSRKNSNLNMSTSWVGWDGVR